MWLRRVLFRVMFPFAVVLPILLLVVRAVLFVNNAGDVLLTLVLTPALVVLLAAVGFLLWSRKSVRQPRAVSSVDAGVLGALYAAVVVAALVEHPAIAIVVAVVGVGAFWYAAWKLLTETRSRLKAALADLEHTVSPAAEYNATMRNSAVNYSQKPTPNAPGAGTVIRIDPPRD